MAIDNHEATHIEMNIGCTCQYEYRRDYVSSSVEYKVEQARRYLMRRKHTCSKIQRRADDGRFYITIIG